MAILSEHAGERPPLRTRFDIPDTENQGWISLEEDAADRRKRRIVAAACRKGTDRLVNHFYPAGTVEEIRAYLDRRDPEELVRSIEELSASVDRE